MGLYGGPGRRQPGPPPQAEPGITYDPASGRIAELLGAAEGSRGDRWRVMVDTDNDGVGDTEAIASEEQFQGNLLLTPEGELPGASTWDFDLPDSVENSYVPIESPVGGALTGDTVQVPYEGFRTFLDQLAKLPPLLTADAGLRSIDVQPGDLPGSELLIKKLNGPNSECTGGCLLALDQLRDELGQLHEDLARSLANYETGQETIELDAAELNRMFQEAVGVDQSVATPTAPPVA